MNEQVIFADLGDVEEQPEPDERKIFIQIARVATALTEDNIEPFREKELRWRLRTLFDLLP